MKTKLFWSARLVLGLIFFVFGLNGFFHFIQVPPPPESGAKFLGALIESGYFFPVLKATEVVAGALLLLGLYVPLALILLAPIVVQIFLYHTLLDPAGFAMGAVIGVLELITAYSVKERFQEVLKR